MTADEFNAPLGQQAVKRRRRLPIEVSHVIVGALTLFFVLFVVWVIVGDGSFGGEPAVTVPIDLRAGRAVTKPEATVPPQAAATPAASPNDRPAVADAPASAPPPKRTAPENTRTVTIIDGKTGARQEVVIPAAPPGISEGSEPAPPPPPPTHRGSNDGEARLKLKGSQ